MLKNLLIIVPNLTLGGQERVAVNMARIMAQDYNVTMVVFDSRNAAYSADCELIDLKIPAAPGKLAKVRNALRRAAALRRLRREREIDYCVSLGPTANFANVLSRGRGKTIVRTSSFADAANSRLNRFIFGNCDQVICCSEEIRKRIIADFSVSEKHAVSVYNPFNIETLFSNGKEDITDYSFRMTTIVAHGRLETVKNYPRLMKAFSLVHKQKSDIQLLIIGEGTLRPKLESLIARYGLQDSVTLLGFRKNPFAYLKRASLYVLPSYHEGFPNALVEGMCFLPVVAADCKSGPREILSNGSLDAVCDGIEEAEYGILVKPSDENEGWIEEITEDDRILAEAILRLLNDPEKYEHYQKRARERAREFSLERFREGLLRVLEG